MPKIFVTDLEKGIIHLKIDDPKQENRLSKDLCDELLNELTNISKSTTIKVLIISGRKNVFCAGATLDMLKEMASDKAEVKDLLLPSKILSFPVPIIGALQGHAVGGGLILALYCDILVAAESSRYGVNFTNMGFTPGMGTISLLPALVGHHFASEMIFTAKLYKGRELKYKGLFNYIVPDEQVMDVAIDIARQIAEKPMYVVRMIKDTLSLSRRQAFQEAVSREDLMHNICFAQPNIISAIENNYFV